MNDLLPEQSPYWQFIEQVLREIAGAYAYHEIRTPILEKTALFVQSIGEQTDIVEKEMFAFEDIGGEHLCMRPECTASVVRAGVQHGLLHNTQCTIVVYGPDVQTRATAKKVGIVNFHSSAWKHLAGQVLKQT